jgi:molybdopterin-guanine dinucleotide biosynthesis protein A
MEIRFIGESISHKFNQFGRIPAHLLEISDAAAQFLNINTIDNGKRWEKWTS